MWAYSELLRMCNSMNIINLFSQCLLFKINDCLFNIQKIIPEYLAIFGTGLVPCDEPCLELPFIVSTDSEGGNKGAVCY